jgi:hypothetical protein
MNKLIALVHFLHTMPGATIDDLCRGLQLTIYAGGFIAPLLLFIGLKITLYRRYWSRCGSSRAAIG